MQSRQECLDYFWRNAWPNFLDYRRERAAVATASAVMPKCL
jgi:hypothetical protein